MSMPRPRIMHRPSLYQSPAAPPGVFEARMPPSDQKLPGIYTNASASPASDETSANPTSCGNVIGPNEQQARIGHKLAGVEPRRTHPALGQAVHTPPRQAGIEAGRMIATAPRVPPVRTSLRNSTLLGPRAGCLDREKKKKSPHSIDKYKPYSICPPAVTRPASSNGRSSSALPQTTVPYVYGAPSCEDDILEDGRRRRVPRNKRAP